MAGKPGHRYKKPPLGGFILRDGWTFSTEPCKRGHTAPRNSRNLCVQCIRDYRKEHGHFTCLPSSRKWREQNREKLNKQRVEYNAKNIERRMVSAAKKSAKNKGVPFDLTIADIFVPEICPVLGMPLQTSFGIRTDSSPSIDRIVPERGYVRGNVIVISMRANRIKNDATADELRKLADFFSKITKD